MAGAEGVGFVGRRSKLRQARAVLEGHGVSQRGGKAWAQNQEPGFGPVPAPNQLDHLGQVTS